MSDQRSAGRGITECIGRGIAECIGRGIAECIGRGITRCVGRGVTEDVEDRRGRTVRKRGVGRKLNRI